MNGEPRLYRVNQVAASADLIEEIEFADVGIRERRHLQEWVANNPGILGENLIIIAKEFSGFDRTNERPDLIAIDEAGNLVVIELKRDDSGTSAHWQAIKYASYFRSVTPDQIVRLLSEFLGINRDDARKALVEHVDADDLADLNREQRIILASHRFAPEVTSAVMWLNEKFAATDPIACVKLTPYRDPATDSTYIQSSVILPVPGTEELTISIGEKEVTGRPASRGPVRNEDEVTRFLRSIATAAMDGLVEEIQPDKVSRWAGAEPDHRYFHLWYSNPPWSNWGASYHLNAYGKDGGPPRSFWIGFVGRRKHLADAIGLDDTTANSLRDSLANLAEIAGQEAYDKDGWIGVGSTVPIGVLDDKLRDAAASILRTMIGSVTPEVSRFAREMNEQ